MEMQQKHIEVPLDEIEKFERIHPSRGAFSWFVREALERYNELNDVSQEELIEIAVKEIRI